MSETGKVPHEEVLAEAKAWLAGIEVGEGRHHKNLTVFPLFRREQSEEDAADGGVGHFGRAKPGGGGSVEVGSESARGSGGAAHAERYVLLADAIEAEQATVEEISEGGQVPFLGVVNTGARPILIPEGEILVGAKQNRTVNITVLVAAGIQFKLPVSCVERGRWRYASRRFEAASYAHPSLREKKLKSAQLNRRMVREAVSDQSEVWEEVDDHLFAMDAFSPTADVVEASRAAAGRVEDYQKKIELPDGACGFVAARGREVVGADLFDSPVTMKKLWRRLGDAYFVGALRSEADGPPASRELAEGFLAAVTRNLEPAPEQPQLGFELELHGDDLAGTALWHEGAVCHLAAFPVAKPAAGGDEYGFEAAS